MQTMNITITGGVVHTIEQIVGYCEPITAQDFVQLIVEEHVRACLNDYIVLLGSVADVRERVLARQSLSIVV